MTRVHCTGRHAPIPIVICAAFALLLAAPVAAQEGRTQQSDPLVVTGDGVIRNGVFSVRLPQGGDWQSLAADASSAHFVSPRQRDAARTATVIWVPTEPASMQDGPKPDEFADMGEVLRWGFRNVMLQQVVLDAGLEARIYNLGVEGRRAVGLWIEPLPHYGKAGELCKAYRILTASQSAGNFEQLPSDSILIGKVCMHPDLVAAVLLEYGWTYVANEAIPELGPEAGKFLDSLEFKAAAS
ncbi:MAG TPA: hypothetical protein ENO23_07230 [Alphaproteobacteria bacterium]|nr:hypothetical protein [Alphaproteobacteria bacterium]